MNILALDLGKSKSVACIYKSHSAEHRYPSGADHTPGIRRSVC